MGKNLQQVDWIFPTMEGRPPITVSAQLFLAGEARKPDDNQTRLHISVKGLVHPYLEKIYPHGCNYIGDASKNPALLPVAHAIAFNLQKAVRTAIDAHGFDKSMPNHYFDDGGKRACEITRFHSTSSNEMILGCDFNASPFFRREGYRKITEEQFLAFGNDIKKAMDAMAPDIQQEINAQVKLQPALDPDAEMIKRTKSAIDEAYHSGVEDMTNAGFVAKTKKIHIPLPPGGNMGLN
jgi:hypothetical protein